MANEFFVSITGERQGPFPGEVTTKGREGTIAAIGFLYEAAVPVDISTGNVTGSHQHHPVRITKRWDATSVLILGALMSGEALTEVSCEFWRTAKEGGEEKYQTVTITGARVIDVKWYTDPDAADTSEDAPVLEDVVFAFQAITVENVDGTSVHDEVGFKG
jgi:type VI secretion system secreted protein Hcp